MGSTEREQRMQGLIREIAERILEKGLKQTTNGVWRVDWEDIIQHTDRTVTLNNRFGYLLLEELRQKKEVAELIATEDCIEMTYHLEYCPQCQEGGISGVMSLISLMGCNLEDVHLVHDEEEHEFATIVELNRNTLTAEGKEEWNDVLTATVKRIYEGACGTQIELSGCSADRLRDFSYMLAGHCSARDYGRWVSDGRESMENDYKNSRAVELIATYEEIYGVPRDRQFTHYFGDYGGHFLNSGVTDAQIRAAYDKGLAAIQMDGPTFQRTDAFLNRREIINRMRACVLSNELQNGARIFFVPTEPLIGAVGFRIGTGRIVSIDTERKTCIVSGDEIDGSMEIPLHHVVARYDPDQQNRNFGAKHAEPLYSMTSTEANDLLIKAREQWDMQDTLEEDAPVQSI